MANEPYEKLFYFITLHFKIKIMVKSPLAYLAGVIILNLSCSGSGTNGSTPPPVPAAPTNLTAKLISPTEVHLSWTDNSTTETGFRVERKSGTGVYSQIGSTSSNVSTYKDLSAQISQAYTYRVYAYNSGNNSFVYSNEVSVNTASITLCGQIWAIDNLNVNNYRNGDAIPKISDPLTWFSANYGAYCYFMYDSARYAKTYGKMYNWYAVNDPRGLAPAGWHIPTWNEFNSLISCQGGNPAASDKLKSQAYWTCGIGNNLSGWTGLPGGHIDYLGNTLSAGMYGGWWSTTPIDNQRANFLGLPCGSSFVSGFAGNGDLKENGNYIRCVKD